MMYLNPEEKTSVPSVAIPKIGVPKIPYVNVFGPTTNDYVIEDTDKPYLYLEGGGALLWENGDKILLEQQKVRVWLQAKARR